MSHPQNSHSKNIAQVTETPPSSMADVIPADPDDRENCLLEQATIMDHSTPSSEIIAIAQEAAACGPIAEDRVIATIARSCRIPKSSIQQQLRHLRDSGGVDDRDQLRHAEDYLIETGRQNLITTVEGTWSWSGSVWRRLDQTELHRQVAHYLRPRLEAVSDRDVTGVSAMITKLAYRPDQTWEQGPADSVNTPTGEITYVDGSWQCLPHQREHYRTIQIPVEWDPSAEAPTFSGYLDSLFQNDSDREEKSQLILELIGYTLMPHCRYQCALFLYGQGSNGKSVLFRVLEVLLGTRNIASVQPSNFDSRFQREHLSGKLANIITEMKKGEVIPDDSFKALTAGESSTVEKKGNDPYDFRPFATLWFAANYFPATRDHGFAFYRRIRVILLNNFFRDSDPKTDPDLPEKLMKELPGILRMSLEAYGAAIDRGSITDPSSSKKARHEWFLETNQTAQFAEECLQNCQGGKIESRKIYKTYREWANAVGIGPSRVLSEKGFSQQMQDLGYTRHRLSNARYFLEIDLTNDGRKYAPKVIF